MQHKLMSDRVITSGTEPCRHYHIVSVGRAVELLWCGAVPVLISSALFSLPPLKSPGRSAQVGSGPAGCSQCSSFEISTNSKYSHVADPPLQILGGRRGLDASLYRHSEPTQV